MALECFNMSPPCLNDLVVLKNSKYSFRYPNIVRDTYRVKTTTYGKNSFKYTAAVLWNDLPDNFRKIAKYYQFTNLKTFYYHGMAMNANVMLVNNFNIIKVFNFYIIIYICLFFSSITCC